MVSAEVVRAMKTMRQVRAEKLLTARELAQRAGLSHATVYMIESGKTVPRLAAVKKLAEALEVDPMEVEELRRAIDVAAKGRGEQEGNLAA